MPRRTTDEERLDRWLCDHGLIITSREALAIGISYAAQAHMVARGRLIRVRQRVYADPRLAASPWLDLQGVLAAAGPSAVASHQSAGELHGLPVPRPVRPHITIPRPRRLRVPDAVVHQTSVAIEREPAHGIWATSASRTLLDVASTPTVSAKQLGACIDEALRRQLTAVPKLEAMLRDWPAARCPGRRRLLTALEVAGYIGAPEASALEARMWRLLHRLHDGHGVPLPVMEHRVEGGRYRLDFAWPEAKLAVEVDGYRWHWSPEAKERDERRRRRLVAQGWKVAVFSWKEVVDEPRATAAEILANYRRATAAA